MRAQRPPPPGLYYPKIFVHKRACRTAWLACVRAGRAQVLTKYCVFSGTEMSNISGFAVDKVGEAGAEGEVAPAEGRFVHAACGMRGGGGLL